MTEVSRQAGSQLDRIEAGVNELNQRMARLEERQNSQGVKMEALEMRTDDHAVRIREVELAHAVSAATGQQTGQQLKGRWAAIGATALVILGSVGAFIGNAVVKLFHIGS